MQRYHAVATVGGGEGGGVITRLVIGLTVPFIRHTSLIGDCALNGLVDGQVQRHHTVAAVGGGEGGGVVARLTIGLVVPFIAAAGLFGDFALNRLVHSEVKGVMGGTEALARNGGLVGARFTFIENVVSISLTITNAFVEHHLLGRIQRIGHFA